MQYANFAVLLLLCSWIRSKMLLSCRHALAFEPHSSSPKSLIETADEAIGVIRQHILLHQQQPYVLYMCMQRYLC